MSGISLRAGERLTWRQRGFVRMVAVGPQGPPGADGAAATDADVAGYLGDPTSQTRVAGDALYASQAQGAAADAAQPAATLDADTAANVADPATQTGQALSAANEAALRPVTAGVPARLFGATTPRPLAEGEPTPAGVIDGVLYGAVGSTGTLKSSSDDGATWTTVTTTFPTSPMRLFPCSDGEILVQTATAIYRSSGWASDPATASFDAKVTAYADAIFFYFSVDGNGTKFVADEYDGATRTNSRYVHVSTDSGNTWSTVWDASVEFPAETQSHLHGCCYDAAADRFWFGYAHSASQGLYYSEDDGATWTRLSGGLADSLSALPTAYCATFDGIVCGTDSATPAGVLGIRRAAAADLAIEAVYRDPFPSGSSPQANMCYRDPATGIVYTVYKAQGAYPVRITAGTATSAGSIWESTTTTNGDSLNRVMVTGSGMLVAVGVFGGVTQVLYARTGRSGYMSHSDFGGVLGGDASMAPGTIAVGPAAYASAPGALAIGPSARAAANRAIAIGSAPAVTGADTVVIGPPDGTFASQFSVLIGSLVPDTGTYTVAIGYEADGGSGSGTVAIGALAKATGVYAMAAGYSAQATATYAIAHGESAKATANYAIAHGQGSVAGHKSSVAAAALVSTTATDQYAIGPRHIELAEIAADPAAPAADSARLYVKDDGAGNTILCVRTSAGVKTVTMA